MFWMTLMATKNIELIIFDDFGLLIVADLKMEFSFLQIKIFNLFIEKKAILEIF